MLKNHTFLGKGWRFPPSFNLGGAQVAMVADEEDIRQSLRILFATARGERIMRPDFGCDLNNALFEEVDRGLVNGLTSMITDAILYHEPRILIDQLDVVPRQTQSGVLDIHLHYTVKTTNDRFNMVYPFYLQEATVPEAP